MVYVIKTENLSKSYGQVKAVNDVFLKVEKGEIYGFLGVNGAGKSTTIRLLLGMLRPDKGAAYLFGEKDVPDYYFVFFFHYDYFIFNDADT